MKKERLVRLGKGKRQETTRELIFSALLGAILSLLGPLALPLPGLATPVTLTVLLLFLFGALFPPRVSFGALGIYLCLGFLGLPVFSGGGSGIGIILSPGGGYLLGYGALLAVQNGSAALLQRTALGKATVCRGLSMLLGLFSLYGVAVSFLCLVLKVEFPAAWLSGVLPFLLPDLCKLGLALCLLPVFCRYPLFQKEKDKKR